MGSDNSVCSHAEDLCKMLWDDLGLTGSDIDMLTSLKNLTALPVKFVDGLESKTVLTRDRWTTKCTISCLYVAMEPAGKKGVSCPSDCDRHAGGRMSIRHTPKCPSCRSHSSQEGACYHQNGVRQKLAEAVLLWKKEGTDAESDDAKGHSFVLDDEEALNTDAEDGDGVEEVIIVPRMWHGCQRNAEAYTLAIRAY